MTRLLVSVRNLDEARVARDAGADLIDIKEPERGSLGAPDAETVRTIVQNLGGEIPFSVALGELFDDAPPLSFAELRGVAFAKCGLVGSITRPDWATRWRDRMGRLPVGTAPVAVVYADAAAGSPPLDDVLAVAVAARAAAVLVDTFDKRSGGLLSHWSLDQVARYVARTQEAGMLAVLAGSLSVGDIEKLLPVGPDFVAVRGAACHGSRLGPIDGDLVERLAWLVKHGSLLRKNVSARADLRPCDR